MFTRLAIAIVVLLGSATTVVASPRAGSCVEAIKGHHVAQAEAKAALATYDACISEHFGMNTCTKPFATLRAAQETYASAVSEKAVQCGQ
jgi:hypothetical protein